MRGPLGYGGSLVSDGPTADEAEAVRLESLWRGDFGDAYVERNAAAGGGRATFWAKHFAGFPARRVLEVGCNVGANLRHVADHVPPGEVWGVDVNDKSLELLRTELPTVNSGWAVARELPFRDGWFDLVFTVAVLIHQPEETLPLAVAEMVRCSRRYVCCIEYVADDTTVVDYRGQHRAFFKRDYAEVVGALYPELALRHHGTASKADGFDDGMGYYVFEKV